MRKSANIGDLRQRRPAISSVFKCLAMLNTEEALALLSELPTDADRIKALDAIIKAAPSAATASLILQLMSRDDAVGKYFRTRLLPGQIDFWSSLDPASALSSSTSTRSCCSESAIQGC